MSRNRERMVEVTPSTIRRLVKEERARLNETLELKARHPSDVAKKTREVDATDYAGTLAIIRPAMPCSLAFSFKRSLSISTI